MSNGLISLFIAVSASTWIYTKLQRSTGNNTKSSATASAIAGGLIFLVSYFVLSTFIK